MRPTSVEPVNERTLTSGWRPSAWPAVSPRPGTTLKTPSGMPGLRGQLGEAERAERSELGRLDDQAVAGGERRGRLPGRHHDREVPGQDRTDHPDRLADDHPKGVAPGRRDRVVQLVDRLGVPAERLDRLRQVRLATIRDRLARLERIEQRQLLGVRLDQVGQAQEDGLALGRGAARPAAVVESAAWPKRRRRRCRRLSPAAMSVKPSDRSPGSRSRIARRSARAGRCRR